MDRQGNSVTGMLLAAGYGERMEPLSSQIPKPALPVLDRPLLAASLECLWRAGCQRVVVNLHRHPERVAAAVRDCTVGREAIFSFEPKLLGPAGGLAAARPYFFPGPVLVANADAWAQLDLTPLLAAGHPQKVVLGLVAHPNHRRWASVHLAEDGRVLRITQPGESREGYLFTGFQLVGAQALKLLPPPPAPMGSFWQALIQQGKLFGVLLPGRFREAGDPGSYWDLIMTLLAGKTFVHPQARVHHQARLEASAVSAGVLIEPSARLRSCVLLPGTTVGEGAELENCIVKGFVPPWFRREGSLVLEGLAPLPLLPSQGKRLPKAAAGVPAKKSY